MIETRRQRLAWTDLEQTLADRDRDVVGVERALDRKQPAAPLILLADADRLVGLAVQLLAHLDFDQRALFLDNDDERKAARKFAQTLGLDRPGAAKLVEAQ